MKIHIKRRNRQAAEKKVLNSVIKEGPVPETLDTDIGHHKSIRTVVPETKSEECEDGTDTSPDTFFSALTAQSKTFLLKRLYSSVDKYDETSLPHKDIIKKYLFLSASDLDNRFWVSSYETRAEMILDNLAELLTDIASYMLRTGTVPEPLESIHDQFNDDEIRKIIRSYMKLELEYPLGKNDLSDFWKRDDVDRLKLSANYKLKKSQRLEDVLYKLLSPKTSADKCEDDTDKSDDTFFSCMTAQTEGFLLKRLWHTVDKYDTNAINEDSRAILKALFSICVKEHSPFLFDREHEEKARILLIDLHNATTNVPAFLLNRNSVPEELEAIHKKHTDSDLLEIVKAYLELEYKYSLGGNQGLIDFWRGDESFKEKVGVAEFVKSDRGVRSALEAFYDIKTDVSDKKAEEEIKLIAFLHEYTPAKLKEYLELHVQGQEEAKITAIAILRNHIKMLLYPNEVSKENGLFIGPSGCGKTHIWRLLSIISPIPILIEDGTKFTTPGFSGLNISDYLEATLKEQDSFILIIDEADKLIRAKHDSSGSNVSFDIQSSLLKLFEDGLVRNDRGRVVGSASRISVVLLGAFSELQLNSKTRSIGFIESDHEAISNYDLEEKLEAYGMTTELFRRIQHISILRPLTEENYLNILNSSTDENPIIPLQRKHILDNIIFTVDDDAKVLVAKYAVAGKIGPSSMNTLLTSISTNMVFEAECKGDECVTVHEDDVRKAVGGLCVR